MAGVESPPYALQNASHGAQLFRLASSAFVGAAQPTTLTSPLYGNPFGSTFIPGSQQAAGQVGGVVGTSDFLITQNGAGNMTVNVAGGQIYIPGGSAAEQGLYYGLSDATTTLTVSAANATNPRIDTVIAFVEDSAYSGSNNDWNLAIAAGTPTAGATLNNLSGAAALTGYPNCVVIGFVLVPANASSILTADILNAQPLASPGFSGFLQRGTPWGIMVPTAQTVIVSGTPTLVGLASANVRGGMVYNATYSYLQVPISGIYRISYQLGWQDAGGGIGAAGTFQAQVWQNGSQALTSSVYASSGNPTPGGCIETYIPQYNYFELYGYQSSGTNEGTSYAGNPVPGSSTWLSVSLVSS